MDGKGEATERHVVMDKELLFLGVIVSSDGYEVPVLVRMMMMMVVMAMIMIMMITMGR